MSTDTASPRLLKAVVQLVYVAEVDGELCEIQSAPHPLTAAEWNALKPVEQATAGSDAIAEQLAAREAAQQQGQAARGTRRVTKAPAKRAKAAPAAD